MFVKKTFPITLSSTTKGFVIESYLPQRGGTVSFESDQRLVKENSCTQIDIRSSATLTCQQEDQQCIEILKNYYLTLANPSTHECTSVDNCQICNDFRAFKHPLMPWPKEIPYTKGDGGLLNPRLVKYQVTSNPMYKDDNEKEKNMPRSAQVTIHCIVLANGLCQEEFNKEYWGHRYDEEVFHYQPNFFEQAVRSYCLTKIQERQLYDWNHDIQIRSEHKLTSKCRKFIQEEFTSHIGPNDNGERSAELKEFIMNNFARTIYWYTDQGKRLGRTKAEESVGGSKHPFISLDSFQVKMKNRGPSWANCMVFKEDE